MKEFKKTTEEKKFNSIKNVTAISKNILKEEPKLKIDLTTKNSLAKYIQDNADELNKLEHSNDKNKLIEFIKRAKISGVRISTSKEREIIDQIKKVPFKSAYQYIYNLLLAGASMGVSEQKEIVKLKKIIKEIILELKTKK